MNMRRNIDPDNHSRIPQSDVMEELKKWRCRMNNSGEEHVETASLQQKRNGEGVLRRSSGNEEINPKTNSMPRNPGGRIHKAFYVRLADESPRNYYEYSDSSAYDSFNCRETDVCRDSSDTDSNSSFISERIGATIKVIEYDVATASSSSGELFTNDSSSGTDDYLLAALICPSPKRSSDFADTEDDSSDSSSTSDPELSSADYWVCLKCKNKQNNPMFRYCEKCYQIRKTHFPPRPRLRKTRSAIKQQRTRPRSTSLKRSSTISNINTRKNSGENAFPTDRLSNSPTSSAVSLRNGTTCNPGRLPVSISQNQLNISAESSSDEDDVSYPPSKYRYGRSNRENKFQKTRSTQRFPMIEQSQKLDVFSKATSLKRKSSQSICELSIKRKLEVESSDICDNENKTGFVLSQSVCTESQGKDSGFSSTPSSQEKFSNDLDNDDGSHDSDTVCEELDDHEVAKIIRNQNFIDTDFNSEGNSLSEHSSQISLDTNSISSHKASPLVKSNSDCSDVYTKMQSISSDTDLLKKSQLNRSRLTSLREFSRQLKRNQSAEIANYGPCMTCLSEPKNGVFVHSKFLHICCCYKCAVKIWNKNKKCPICNCAVKNVMKVFVH